MSKSLEKFDEGTLLAFSNNLQKLVELQEQAIQLEYKMLRATLRRQMEVQESKIRKSGQTSVAVKWLDLIADFEDYCRDGRSTNPMYFFLKLKNSRFFREKYAILDLDMFDSQKNKESEDTCVEDKQPRMKP